MLAAAVAAAPASPVFADDLAPLKIGTKFLKGASLRLYGFVEADSIYDTTQSFTEEPDSNLVQKRSSILGQRSREQMSVRDSRLGLELDIPATDSGWKTLGVFEADFLGDNAGNAAPGTTPNPQTERDYYNSPSLRVRHAYFKLDTPVLDVLVGQYWHPMMQPLYMPNSVQIQGLPGQLYARTPQVRLSKTIDTGAVTVQIDAAAQEFAGVDGVA